MKHIKQFNESKIDITKYNELSNYQWSFEKGEKGYYDFIYTIIKKDLGKDTNGEQLTIEVKIEFGVEYGGCILSINNKNSLSKGLFGKLLKTSEPGGYTNGDGLNSSVEESMIEFLGIQKLIDQLKSIIGSNISTSKLFKSINNEISKIL